jgi:hypothetical protein
VLAALNWLVDFLSLAAAAKAVGLGLAPYEVALVYFAAQAAGSALPLLPGGLGAIDGSMVVGLAAFGAAPAAAGAATGLYRLVSYWAVVAVGWLAWLALRAGDSPRLRARLLRAPLLRTRLLRTPQGLRAGISALGEGLGPLSGSALPAAASACSGSGAGSGPGSVPASVPADPH